MAWSGGRIVGVGILVVALLVGGALLVGTFLIRAESPSEEEAAEIVALEEGHLDDVDVEEVERLDSRLWSFTGTAVLAEDRYDLLYYEDAAALCEVEALGYQDALFSLQVQRVYERTHTAGLPVTFETDGGVERTDEEDPAEVTASGWTALGWRATVTAEDGTVVSPYPEAGLGEEPAVRVLTDEQDRQDFCADVHRAVPPGT